MTERMVIMEDLKTRKRNAMKGSPCPSCGLDNDCYMDQGKSPTLCWCMKMPYREIGNTDTCYCKNCLKGD